MTNHPNPEATTGEADAWRAGAQWGMRQGTVTMSNPIISQPTPCSYCVNGRATRPPLRIQCGHCGGTATAPPRAQQMTPLVALLREFAGPQYPDDICGKRAMSEAADEIARLQAEVASLRLTLGGRTFSGSPIPDPVGCPCPGACAQAAEIGRLRAENEAYARGRAEAWAWRPIETVPRDGTDVLVWVPAVVLRDGFVLREACAVVAEGSHNCWGESHMTGRDVDGPLSDKQPTHWMPLPPPPENARALAAGAGDDAGGGQGAEDAVRASGGQHSDSGGGGA